RCVAIMNAGSATTAATPSQDNAACPPQDARRRFRDGLITPTSGWSAGYAQANIVMVPSDWAPDVLLFAQRNPQAVPLLDVSEAGETGARLAAEADYGPISRYIAFGKTAPWSRSRAR